jgi:hypothetical protein
MKKKLDTASITNELEESFSKTGKGFRLGKLLKHRRPRQKPRVLPRLQA